MEQYINLTLFLALVIYPLFLGVITLVLEWKENRQKMSDTQGVKEIIEFLDAHFPEHTGHEKYIELLYLCLAGVKAGYFFAVATDDKGGFVLVEPLDATPEQVKNIIPYAQFNLLIAQLIAGTGGNNESIVS